MKVLLETLKEGQIFVGDGIDMNGNKVFTSGKLLERRKDGKFVILNNGIRVAATGKTPVIIPG